MTDRELDAAIAERVMGQVECDKWYQMNMGSAGGPCMSLNLGLPQADGKYHCANGHEKGKCYAPDTGYPGSGPAKFSTDRNAASKVLGRINELGLSLDFAERALFAVGALHLSRSREAWWLLLNITAYQICEVALKCLPDALRPAEVSAGSEGHNHAG